MRFKVRPCAAGRTFDGTRGGELTSALEDPVKDAATLGNCGSRRTAVIRAPFGAAVWRHDAQNMGVILCRSVDSARASI